MDRSTTEPYCDAPSDVQLFPRSCVPLNSSESPGYAAPPAALYPSGLGFEVPTASKWLPSSLAQRLAHITHHCSRFKNDVELFMRIYIAHENRRVSRDSPSVGALNLSSPA